MARPTKNGLDYFPLDVDIFSDQKLRFIRARFDEKGELIAIKILCEIYRNGYYTEWNDDISLIFSDSAGRNITANLANDVVQELVKRGFFDKGIFDRFKLLTSKGIQKRFLPAVKDRKDVEIISEYWLINLPENTKNTTFIIKSAETGISSAGNEVNSAGNDTNKTKVNKTKSKEKKEADSSEPLPGSLPAAEKSDVFISFLLNDGTEYDVTAEKVKYYAELYPAVNIEQDLRDITGWCFANKDKRKTRRGAESFINRWLAKTQNTGGSKSGNISGNHAGNAGGEARAPAQKVTVTEL
jgi:hypothetical protein